MSNGILASIKLAQIAHAALSESAREVHQQEYDHSVFDHGSDRMEFELIAPSKRTAVLVAVKLKELASHQLWLNTSALFGEIIPKGGIFFIDLDGEQSPYLVSYTDVDAVSYTHLTLPTTPYV